MEINGLRVSSFLFQNANPDAMKKIADKMTASVPNIVIVIGTIRDGKGTWWQPVDPRRLKRAWLPVR